MWAMVLAIISIANIPRDELARKWDEAKTLAWVRQWQKATDQRIQQKHQEIEKKMRERGLGPPM